jgi:hypothetical protein
MSGWEDADALGVTERYAWRVGFGRSTPQNGRRLRYARPGASVLRVDVSHGVGRQEYRCARKSQCGRTTGLHVISTGERRPAEAADPRSARRFWLPLSLSSLASAASIRRSSIPSGCRAQAPMRREYLLPRRGQRGGSESSLRFRCRRVVTQLRVRLRPQRRVLRRPLASR